MKFARALRWFLLGLFLAVSVDAVAQYTVVGRAAYRLFVGSTELLGVRALVLPSGTTCDGGTCTLGGGGGAIDAGTFVKSPSSRCTTNALKTASNSVGDDQCSPTTVEPTGSIAMPSGSTINGLDPEAAKTKLDGLPTRTITTAEYKAGTQDWDYCFDSVVQTTNATATVFYRMQYRASEQVHFKYQCSAAQLDGGTLLGAKYSREAFVTSQDGGVTGSLVGGVDTVGTDREQDTSWTGPNAVQFDGGLGDGGPSYIIAELSLQGVTGEPTITWYCSGCWKKTPRSDSGIP